MATKKRTRSPAKTPARTARASAARKSPVPGDDVAKYHAALEEGARSICALLNREIRAVLKGADCKVWHGSPVWFLDGNPIVGYDKLKDCVRLLFWSGQSFEAPGLTAEGSFKAAEARYQTLSDVDTRALRRWLRESKLVQWDYQNIVKRKGRLQRLV